MRVRFWNDDRRKELKRLWRDPAWTREAIAAHLGITARAVCAERTRLGLKPRPPGQMPKSVKRVRPGDAVPVIRPVQKPAPVAGLAWPPSRGRLMAGR